MEKGSRSWSGRAAKQPPKATKTKLRCDQQNLQKKDINVLHAAVTSREGYPGA